MKRTTKVSAVTNRKSRAATQKKAPMKRTTASQREIPRATPARKRGSNVASKLRQVQNEKRNQIFSKIYYNPRHPASFGSIDRLLTASKRQEPSIERRDVVHWVSGQDTYTLHRQARRKFQRRKTIVPGIDHQWQIDLVDVQNLQKYNNGVKYLLTKIDVFSRRAAALPLRTKTGREVAQALKELFEREKVYPKYLHSDLGKEFRNASVLKLLEDLGIKLFSVHSETKAALVERWNRTLKSKVYKMFTKNNTRRYIDILPDLVESYNNIVHRITKLAPNQVNASNEKALWLHLYGKEFPTKTNFKFQKGDTVRVSQLAQVFGKGYKPQYTTEWFVVAHRRSTKPPTYKLRDEHGELLDGSFYEEEMQRIQRPSDASAFHVDILKKRRRNKKS
ncbi:uncharacterized protein LOC135495098 [Lineus longissimus]|uniref:uncharacterized protein LOC135495098 n=1 Tax=Lineus longissimus TaxID=88925 RepID=UPI00315DE39E